MLRAEGMSIKRIARKLGVAVSSVSVWVRDVPVLSPKPSPGPRHTEPMVLDPVGKTCGRCRERRSRSHFNRAGGGHQHWCRDCFRSYFQHRGALHVRQANQARAKRIAATTALFRRRLAESACTDCGEDEIAVLEFDHVGEKRDAVPRLVLEGASLAEVKAELAQCEVVCVCCHRRRTAFRGDWARAVGAPASWTPARRRNHEHIVAVLTFGGCVDCGERDPVVLEFDHMPSARWRNASVLQLSPTGDPRLPRRHLAKRPGVGGVGANFPVPASVV